MKLKTVLNDSNKTDTDLDGLYDWDEVNVDIVNRHLKNEGKQELKTINNSDLPLFSDLILHSSEWGSFKPYLWSESDFARYAYANCFDNVRILPIVSSLVDSDGDSDGIIDNYDKNALKFCGNNDDILNDYSEAFVTLFTSKPNEEVKINSSKSELKLFPYENSKTIEIIDNNSDNTYTVDCVVLTSSKSWVKVKYKDKFGYIDGDYVVVNNDNDSLLRIMFSDMSILEGIHYLPYWHIDGYDKEDIDIEVPNNTIYIQSGNRYVDTSINPIDRQTVNSSEENKKYLTISQSELGFLYAMTKEMGDDCGINELNNNVRSEKNMESIDNGMFEWLLSATMHESQCGMSYKPNTWKNDYIVDNGISATGYFQCTYYPQKQMESDIIIKWILKNWSAKAIRLDMVYESNNICSLKWYYGNCVVAANILTNAQRFAFIDKTNPKYKELMQAWIQYYAKGNLKPEDGYRASEFISILDEIIENYAVRWR